MKTLILAIITTLVFSSGAFAQEPGSFEKPYFQYQFFYDSARTYKITIESANGVVSTLEVPPGVLLNVNVVNEQYASCDEECSYPHRYWGEVDIRLRRDDELEEGESNVLRDIMAKSPAAISLKEAVVVVDTVAVSPES